MTDIDQQTGKAFERRDRAGVDRKCSVEMFARRRPIHATQLRNAQCTMCIGECRIGCQRTFCCRFRKLRQRRLIFAADAQVADSKQRTRARKCAMTACQRFKLFDLLYGVRTGSWRLSEARCLRGQQTVAAIYEGLVDRGVLRPERSGSWRIAARCTEKGRQMLREALHRREI